MKLPSIRIEWTRRRVVAAYAAFAVIAFVLSLRWTFPAEAMKERLMMEAGQRGWQIDVDRVSAGGGLLGVRAHGLKLETASGLSIPIDDLTASLRVLPLLTGRRSIAFDADLYDGRVRGTADLSGDVRQVVVDVQGVDLGRALPLRKAAGVDLVGIVTGSVELSVPAAAGGTTGHVDLSVKDAGIAGGQLPLPGMSGGLPLPKTALGRVVAALKLAGGKGTFEKLEATGGDAEIRADGLSFPVQPRMEFAPLAGKARVKIGDAFWSRSGMQGFKGLAEAALASSKGSDGSWNLAITGSVGHPRVNPAAR